jgi:nucleotide-binding universal stress UspA family protein
MTTNIQPGSIVVGVDGSPDADRAVQWAAEQAALERRPLVVFAAVSPTPAMVGSWPGPVYVYPAEELLESAQAVADQAASLAVAHRPGIAPQTAIAAVDSRTALTDLSADAHLLVLGSRGRGRVSSKLLGSVGASVTKHAECPVVVCRPGTHLRVKNGVLVGADGTAESLPVIDFAFRQASLRSQPLTVLHSFFDVVATVTGPSQADDDPDAEPHRLVVAESIAGFRERYPEVHVNVHVARGFADDTLATVADVHDLVVVGRHPVDSVTRRLWGAVATAVLERSHTTIAVVPEAAAVARTPATR